MSGVMLISASPRRFVVWPAATIVMPVSPSILVEPSSSTVGQGVVSVVVRAVVRKPRDLWVGS